MSQALRSSEIRTAESEQCPECGRFVNVLVNDHKCPFCGYEGGVWP